MTRRFPYQIVDVFAEAAFGGNQLAVLTDATGLSGPEMQAIAREFNFAETSFVLPAVDERHTASVRIFTPRAELPFAGHPTVGTAAVLASLGRGQSANGVTELVLEEKIGPIRVIVEPSATGRSARFTLAAPVERPDSAPSPANLARVLGLRPSDVVECWFAGIGPRFCFTRLSSASAVDAAVLDRAVWRAELADAWSSQVHVFSGDPSVSGELYARMFAPAFGIDEDPATGSAAAALVASAATKVADGTLQLRIRQGVLMGRPSVIDATAEKVAGEVRAVHVSGNVIDVAEGSLTVP